MEEKNRAHQVNKELCFLSLLLPFYHCGIFYRLIFLFNKLRDWYLTSVRHWPEVWGIESGALGETNWMTFSFLLPPTPQRPLWTQSLHPGLKL